MFHDLACSKLPGVYFDAENLGLVYLGPGALDACLQRACGLYLTCTTYIASLLRFFKRPRLDPKIPKQNVRRQSADCSASIYAQALLTLISLSRPSPSYPVVCRNFHTLSQSAEPTQPDRRTILKMTSDVLQTRWLQEGYKVSRRRRSRPSYQTKRCISTIRRAAATKKGPR